MSTEEPFDFGFTAVNEDELGSILGPSKPEVESASAEEIREMQDKLDLILQINSTCDGANEVKDQYDILLQAKMNEIESVVMPLLQNLKKNPEKDYLYWPGAQRVTQCDLQMQKLMNITRG
jgi:hypothetical protein